MLKKNLKKICKIMDINRYKTIIFDCDGVILNSNRIKTQAFKETLSNYKKELVDEFISYHESNGGISRYEKIRFFVEELALNYNYINEKKNYSFLLNLFSKICRKSLYEVEVASGLRSLRKINNKTKWLIVSGGDQDELRDIFLKKGISDYFNGGIYGSPDKKKDIISREISLTNIIKPALFIGDSKLDFYAANSNQLDFIFLTDWTDYRDYKEFCSKNKITYMNNINSILANIKK